MTKHTIFYTLLVCSSFLGFTTSYFPGVIGQPAGFWLSDLIATLSYFTIISNLLILALSASQLFSPASNFALWMTKASVQTSIAVYITITGLVYHFLLTDTWDPQGIDWVSDKLLHYVTPILYVLFWWNCVRGKLMPFKGTFWVLTVPALYLVYWLIRGPLVGSYPYYFLDAAQYGYGYVLINALGLCLLYWFVAVIYWALSKFWVPLYV